MTFLFRTRIIIESYKKAATQIVSLKTSDHFRGHYKNQPKPGAFLIPTKMANLITAVLVNFLPIPNPAIYAIVWSFIFCWLYFLIHVYTPKTNMDTPWFGKRDSFWIWPFLVKFLSICHHVNVHGFDQCSGIVGKGSSYHPWYNPPKKDTLNNPPVALFLISLIWVFP